MKRVLIKLSLFLLGILLVLTPLGIFALATHNHAHIYNKSYSAALIDKVNYLESVKNEKKIVLIGGSNVAFGFDSELLEQEFSDYKVVNFGLYANLGTKIMMDLAIHYVGKDDLVFIIPEVNTQSTSLFFNSVDVWQAIEDRPDLIWKLPEDNRLAAIGGYVEFSNERNKHDAVVEPEGVYQRKNFNKYGDILYEELDDNGIPYRAANRMKVHYDPTMPVDYSYKIDQSFFNYLNSYNSEIKNKNAKLYYSFSPVNSMSVINKDDLSNYYWSIRNHLSFDVVGNPDEYIIDPHYFYDSNFHLNDAGAILRTYKFAQDIYRDVELSKKSPSFDEPEMPGYVSDGDITDETDVLTVYRYPCSKEQVNKLTETSYVLLQTTLQKYIKNDKPRPLTAVVDSLYAEQDIPEDIDYIEVNDALDIIEKLDNDEITEEKYWILGRIIEINNPYTSDNGYISFTIQNDSETADYFEYSDMEKSSLISGVSEEHLDDENFTLPAFANGKRVVGIAEDAFNGSTKLNDLVIPLSIGILMDGCFGNCDSLKSVYIETFDPEDIIVSYTGSMTRNTVPDFKIYIHKESITIFSTNYYWGNYSSYFVGY